MKAVSAPVLKMPMVELLAHCEVHGEYVATVIVRDGDPRPAECGICASEDRRREYDQDSRERIEKMQITRRAAVLDRLELPGWMGEKRWDDYQPKTSKAGSFLKLCKQYAIDWQDTDSRPGNIAMVGTTGTGKTHLASMIAKQVAVENSSTVLYTTVARMSRYVRASFSKQAPYTQTQAFERYVSLDLLVMDEVGLNLSSAFERGLIDELIDERSMRRAPTIMISNLSILELEKLAERLMDRMRDNGTFMVFDWESHRGRNHE